MSLRSRAMISFRSCAVDGSSGVDSGVWVGRENVHGKTEPRRAW
jgi:hypothetical protein